MLIEPGNSIGPDAVRSAASIEVPVVLIVFNRETFTQRLMTALAQVRPTRIMVIADGPRAGRINEQEICERVRSIATTPSWPCDVQKCFSDRNLGIRTRFESGLNWVFDQTDRAIILEDDCIPSPSFFPFAQTLLERYADDQRIGTIAGFNGLGEVRTCTESYFFSKFFFGWGWATWRRTWQKYDVALTKLDSAFQSEIWPGIFENRYQEIFWRDKFERTRSGTINTWDYQMVFLSFVNSWLNVIPKRNLIENIGFGELGTHTRGSVPAFISDAQTIEFPLVHPNFIVRNRTADEFLARQVVGVSNLMSYALYRAKRLYWGLRFD